MNTRLFAAIVLSGANITGGAVAITAVRVAAVVGATGLSACELNGTTGACAGFCGVVAPYDSGVATVRDSGIAAPIDMGMPLYYPDLAPMSAPDMTVGLAPSDLGPSQIEDGSPPPDLGHLLGIGPIDASFAPARG